MDRFKNLLTPAILLFLLGLVLLGTAAQAGEDRQCSVTFTAGVAGTTATPSAGTCSWGLGATILMQCDQAVYWTQAPGATASATDFKVDFTANSDPYIAYLSPNSKTISVLGVTAAGTCKFGATSVRRTSK